MKYFNALTIAGTDPSGGAGIQADLKTFSALKTYGCSVITALVAQNSSGVNSIHNIRADFITAQMKSVFSDLQIDTVKIGMLANADIVEVVTEQLKDYKLNNIVLDPVIFAKSGDQLLSSSGIRSLKNKLLPIIDIITPNLPEAAVLLDSSLANNEEDMINQGKSLLSFGCNAVLIKGGHLNSNESPDWLITQKRVQRFTVPRIQVKNIHGAGCTLSAALAALLPRYTKLEDVIFEAKTWLSSAIVQANLIKIDKNVGTIHHFHEWW